MCSRRNAPIAALTSMASSVCGGGTTGEISALANSDAPPYWSMPRKVTCPTLLAWGGDDRQCPPDMAMIERVIIEFLNR
jgi:pimeloyl-ACP methyl ester carboxylesterase